VAIEIKILNHGDMDILKNVDPDVFDDLAVVTIHRRSLHSNAYANRPLRGDLL
jgi:hypothetical protein